MLFALKTAFWFKITEGRHTEMTRQMLKIMLRIICFMKFQLKNNH